jgi:hypothetical protein
MLQLGVTSIWNVKNVRHSNQPLIQAHIFLHENLNLANQTEETPQNNQPNSSNPSGSNKHAFKEANNSFPKRNLEVCTWVRRKC